MHGSEVEARRGDILVDYNRSCKRSVIGQTLDSLQMRERSGASVLVVLREGQALANPEPGLVCFGLSIRAPPRSPARAFDRLHMA